MSDPVEYIVQKLDREREAKNKAIVEANDRKRAGMTKEERIRQTEKDSADLFGDE